MLGRVLSERYEILELIGAGGMSTVYKARDLVLDRIVAVKILKDEFKADSSFVQRFKTEATAAARLSHSNIVNVYDVGQEGHDYFIVMEYIDGHTLAVFIDKNGPFNQYIACEIACMICEGVQHAHERGVIHRDIKPHNIIMTSDGVCKVADFGIAHAISKATITYGNNIVGSVHYISPEQAKGLPLDGTADIYSIGCVLYEMLTGRVPFNAESPVTVALKHIHDEAVEPHLINSDITPAVEAVVLKAMSKDSSERFRSASQMRDAIMRAEGNTPPADGYVSVPRRQVIVPEVLLQPQEGADMVDRQKAKKRKIPMIWVVLAAIGVLGLVAGSLLGVLGNSLNFFQKEVEVPLLINSSVREAKTELDKLGLLLVVSEEEVYNDDIAVGMIALQDPGEGRIVKEGREVIVMLSMGSAMVKVPRVEGRDLSTATLILKNQDLEVGETEKVFHDTIAEGIIISQHPLADQEVEPGSKVDLSISQGKQLEPVEVPNLIGLTVDQATDKLSQLGLKIGTIRKEGSNTHFTDIIFQQSISAGTMLETESGINVVVSTGPGPRAEEKPIEFTLPSEQDSYELVLRIKDGHGVREDYYGTRSGGDRLRANIIYYGSGTVEVILDTVHYQTFNL